MEGHLEDALKTEYSTVYTTVHSVVSNYDMLIGLAEKVPYPKDAPILWVLSL
jgi:hypothetical protein